MLLLQCAAICDSGSVSPASASFHNERNPITSRSSCHCCKANSDVVIVEITRDFPRNDVSDDLDWPSNRCVLVQWQGCSALTVVCHVALKN
jgi:hypothetical protein